MLVLMLVLMQSLGLQRQRRSPGSCPAYHMLCPALPSDVMPSSPLPAVPLDAVLRQSSLSIAAGEEREIVRSREPDHDLARSPSARARCEGEIDE